MHQMDMNLALRAMLMALAALQSVAALGQANPPASADSVQRGDGAAMRAAIRADGTLLVNDKPVFPIGMRTEMLESIKTIAEGGFNLVLGSGEWGPDHYRAAAENKLLILGGFYEWASFASFRGNHGLDLRPSEEEGLKTVLRQARDQKRHTIPEALSSFDGLPNVIGWNINEEPEA
jgi:hypothetical protein